MKIAFDHNIFTRQRYGGISRYITRLMVAYNNIGHSVKVFAPFHSNAYLQELPSELVKGISCTTNFYKVKGPFLYLNDPICRMQMAQWKPEIVHETYFAPRRPAPKKTPLVVTVHDMTHERFPKLFKPSDPSRMLKKKAIKRADAIICISEYTKKDLLDIYPEVEDRVKVVLHGFEPLPESKEIKTHPLNGTPYFLFVGHRGGYKNFSGLLAAYSNATTLKNEFHLVAFGGGGWSAEEMEFIRKAGIENKVKQINGCDETLASYYRNAHVFVLPSLYEGFGFPLLESMSLGCPVVCSRSSALPEVAGEAALYFDPLNMDDIITILEKAAHDNPLRQQLIRKGFERAKRFEWIQCAHQTLDVYQHCITQYS